MEKDKSSITEEKLLDVREQAETLKSQKSKEESYEVDHHLRRKTEGGIGKLCLHFEVSNVR